MKKLAWCTLLLALVASAAVAQQTGRVVGRVVSTDGEPAFDAADPTLVYFIFKWIKKYYHRDHEESEIVRGKAGTRIGAQWGSLEIEEVS